MRSEGLKTCLLALIVLSVCSGARAAIANCVETAVEKDGKEFCRECDRGFFPVVPNSYSCERCASKCRTCGGEATNCFSCFDGRYLSGSDCKECVEGCAKCGMFGRCTLCNEGYYNHTSIDVCVHCTYQCASCHSPNQCSKCKEGFSLSKDAEGVDRCENGASGAVAGAFGVLAVIFFCVCIPTVSYFLCCKKAGSTAPPQNSDNSIGYQAAPVFPPPPSGARQGNGYN